MQALLTSPTEQMVPSLQARGAPAGRFGPAPPEPATTADVLAVNRVGFFGGVERVILTAATCAAAHGWRTALACPPGDLAEEARLRQIPVQPIEICSLSRAQVGKTPASWARTAGQVRRGGQAILRAASAAQARILHVHHPAAALQARRAARLRKTPLIWHVHETAPIPLAYRALGGTAARTCDLILCVSRASRAMALELGAPETRARLVYNAVEARFFERAYPVRLPADGGPNVGVFGVLEPRKGHADLIQACATLMDRWPTLNLWIVGGLSFEQHGPYEAGLKRLARDLGMADRVHFTGRRDDIPDLMAAMDAVVSPSVGFESLPTVLIEACALGVPVLGTDVGGVREIIRHGETGLLAPPRTPGALAHHLALLLSGAGRPMADRAQTETRRRFSPARFAADIHESYCELAWPSGRSRP
jgi:glycosyltransferase involved in cell wall biosynthesis